MLGPIIAWLDALVVPDAVTCLVEAKDLTKNEWPVGMSITDEDIGLAPVVGLERGHEMMAELVESFNVFFLIPDAERAATEQCGVVWRILLHERCVVLEDVEDTALVCALLIAIEERTLPDARAVARCLGETDGLSQADQARVLRTLTPFITARARGPMPPPGRLYLRRDDPGEGG